MGGAYYNEWDKDAAAWLRELIRRGLIADGDVDQRSILDVSADDLKGYTQCHFFAGIGGWSYALRLAGWPDDAPVWTGSPPCQPFSSAGRQKGKDDERHLAPHFVGLVGTARPALLFGEQVASAAVFGPAPKGNRPGFEGAPPWTWLDDLSDRLEAAHYAVGASDFSSAGVGAPHIRQRTFFGAVRLADSNYAGLEGWRQPGCGRAFECSAGSSGVVGGMGDSTGGRQWSSQCDQNGNAREHRTGSIAGGMGDAFDIGRQFESLQRRSDATGMGKGGRQQVEFSQDGVCTSNGEPSSASSHSPWSTSDWLYCRDGKWRPVESGTFPLADGIPARVGRLRGYGNAINPWAAKAFIETFIESLAVGDDDQDLL